MRFGRSEYFFSPLKREGCMYPFPFSFSIQPLDVKSSLRNSNEVLSRLWQASVLTAITPHGLDSIHSLGRWGGLCITGLLIISCDIWQSDCSPVRRGRAELGQGGGGCSAVVPSVQSGGVGVEWGVVVWNSPLGSLWRRAGPAGRSRAHG